MVVGCSQHNTLVIRLLVHNQPTTTKINPLLVLVVWEL